MNGKDDQRKDAGRRHDVERLLGEFRPEAKSSRDPSIQKAIYLARELQRTATELQTPQERRQQAELDRMIQNAHDKTTLLQLTDQAFRSEVPHRAVDQLVHILDVQGIPRFFSPLDRTLLKGFQSFGSYLPGVAVPLVKEKMQHETANVILPAEREMLTEHLDARCQEGVRMNVNYLGEALLGERAAEQRLNSYLRSLQLPELEVISVKISTIFSQILPIAREHTLTVLCNRLELLYRAAAKERFTRADGTLVPKFVYLDMEEYRDVAITAEAFMRTLDRPGLQNVSAGIALQAYVPDSFRTQLQINKWARHRVAAGGAPITLRIVKGANMEMERVEASLHGWPQAPFKTKKETDANYKRMLNEGMREENLLAVRLGIASHNLFDVAYGLVLAAERNALDQVQIEMLEGMANHQRRALFQLYKNLLLYAPACKKEDFIYAIGYLVRRLDENTGPDNFLRHAFKVEVDSPDWDRLAQSFVESFEAIETLSDQPRRNQDRAQLAPSAAGPFGDGAAFTNEPDTDFALPQNIEWAERLIEQWRPRCEEQAEQIPLVIDGQEIVDDRTVRDCYDPSRPGTVVGRYRQATAEDVDRAVASAASDPDGWRDKNWAQRSEVLARVADEIRAARGDLIGAALADGGKILTESDPEVSEAVDFVEYYRRAAAQLADLPGIDANGIGIVAVVAPWNFPIAIPCGGIAAALAAGNTVLLKPASDTVLVAWYLCQCFWRGGISKRTLQFLPCSGASEGQHLVSHQQVDAVILTGGTETAASMLRHRPDMNLHAETGGKNATIVTSLADRDQAIKNVVHSAFSHSGQKCSATSLLILEEEVYDDPQFREELCDAIESLDVGSSWEVQRRVGPLIRPPGGDLEVGLKELESDESWAVRPRRDETNPQLFSPGVKWDVSPGSYTHLTEFFGPVLAVIKAKNLSDAIKIVNATGYGLTSGLESLDDREQELWQHSIRAGNLYINRSTTGAIVLRQPFGGLGKSAFGPGVKAGGPNYVAPFMRFSDQRMPETSDDLQDPQLQGLHEKLSDLTDDPSYPSGQIADVMTAIASYDFYQREEFGRAHDHFRLIGEDNFRRYQPVAEVRIRSHSEDTFFELFARACAARVAGSRVTISMLPGESTTAVKALENLT
ncbi:MAG TPA: bifunctional proline dehydrogenase/L-glutamate gamma-semialdehyde dehydrogenase, partial [Pirellulales bacterium]|nr:bifunctional proline dehydrogenase/L-glutamate gamma-semialdehyde dehydrogenase [Pirellulales bacterium]